MDILSPKIAGKVLKLWAEAMLSPRSSNIAVRKFYAENNCNPPWFLVISPGHACNLKCGDCYAGSATGNVNLEWNVLERIVDDARKLWDIKMVVFSGGEPFLYCSRGKDILDLVEKHPECLFLAFTNGTLIDKINAHRIAKLGNITLAFSVEGMCSTTDSRRGKGTFSKVLKSMGLMRKTGVPFGISVTVYRDNCSEVLSDEFLDFFFKQQGIFYSFYFQYLPIGRNARFELMPLPEQRIEFWRKTWEIVEQKRLFLIDFWNHGPLAEGCISAGRDGGYLYIDWNGKVMPCVFTPYSVANIHEVYKNGKTLNDIWHSGLLKAIRQWQREYGYGKIAPEATGNWLRPCPYRDHHGKFVGWLNEFIPDPEDGIAGEVVSNLIYHNNMIDYDEKLAELVDPIWKTEYCEPG
jgi:MoaA/NifB/PqqE/SkfB family radical SAM enzyme